MFELIQKGGVVMYPIILLSIISLAIFIERLFVLRREKVSPLPLAADLKAAARKGDALEMQRLCEANNLPITRIAKDILENRTEKNLSHIAESSANSELDKLTQFQEALSYIVGLAPLLGLLGTVFGMIRLFNVLSGGGIGDAHELSGGIAEALLTTAAGLIVAIPAQIFHFIVSARAETVVRVLEKDAADILNIVSGA